VIGASLPLEVQTDLFRVVQEALANVHRHSGSRVAIVRFEEKAEQSCCRFEMGSGMSHWNGATMSPEAIGVGISSMRERLKQVGGRLEIESGSHGTTITAIVPLKSHRPPASLRPRLTRSTRITERKCEKLTDSERMQSVTT
jgi:signal transduction histidine kinase